MHKFMNMKIEINEDQSVEEIVIELERLGYTRQHNSRNPSVVYTGTGGGYGTYMNTTMDPPNATLSDLKNMN